MDGNGGSGWRGNQQAWKLPENDFTRQSPVTLRKLLTHTAGTTVHGFPGYEAHAKLPATTQVLDGVTPANTPAVRVDALPGAAFRYSGGGFTVAQQVVHDVTGVPLPGFMRDAVLAPLNMARSTYEQPLPPERMAEAAAAYRGDGSAVPGGPHAYPEMAAAGLWTTPTDLAHYALGVRAALAGNSKVITAETARAMLAPGTGGHGLGPAIGGRTQRKLFTHGGANAGYRCVFVAYEDGEGAVVMTNGDNGGELANEVMRTIAHVYQWPDYSPPIRVVAQVKPEAVDRLAGVYELNDGSLYAVRKSGEQLVGHVVGQKAVALYASSEHELFAKADNVLLKFTLDANGVPASVQHRWGEWERNGARISEARAQPALRGIEQADQRFKDQKPRAQAEAAIRKLFLDIAAGKPDYERMSAGFANITRQQLAGMQGFVKGLGEMRRLAFQRVNEDGSDEYHADFANGALTISIVLGDDDRIDGVRVQPG
ncbi:serine hydrolase domain-containing protein [Pelomonas aquatica]|uniref:serine hydrolase domain-containing protein n=1 Tax=Pelomonas aquatica TaxID=431058 RepID=UPI00286A3C6B|nr:serine hydrolase domain-containing protein [Pelomonas aquatica]